MKTLTPALALIACLHLTAHYAQAANEATGVVFHDANNNRRFDSGEKPLPNVRVSNGKDITRTDDAGRYRLPVGDDTIIFVIKPRGWRTPLNAHKLPRFFYIHKPKGSPKSRYPGVEPTGPLPKSIDFPLYPQKEPDKFRAIMFGDPQPRDQKEIDYIADDVVSELIGADASFGVTLGDIMFDNLSLFKSLNATIAMIGIPWYNVIGNHDINFDAPNDKLSDETFERVYGPSYYSFDYGPVHFLVIDDVEWYIPEPGKRGKYRGGIGPRQLAFIKNDLAMIPNDQLVVLMMHIPIIGVQDRQDLYRLIEKRSFTMSISGHTHDHRHVYIKKKDGWNGPKPHHHIINVTVSGSWWSGKPDERGIPHATMGDGAPNGYSIITFDGQRYSIDFKAAGKPANYQMNITAPKVVNQPDAAKTAVYANVFNGSERAKVELRIVGQTDWLPMTRTVSVDPSYKAQAEAEKANPNRNYRPMAGAKTSSHLWKTSLPKVDHAGTHLIHVRAVLDNGKTVEGHRIIRIR